MFPQDSTPDKHALDLGIIQLHQLSSYQITFNNPEALGYGLQGGHPFRSTLGAQLKCRVIGRADLYPWQVS